ncbi:MAG: ExbD/TolR family protein [Pelagimonas sp.]|uniref:ExbD/TolR family protein n=1 Tax=Pelagimonas sp. TaxID=2073170 RepID=UPI003D6B7C3A
MIRRRKKSQREPTIALINIVFLMLVFFLVAGTVAKPLDKTLTLVKTSSLAGAPPVDALVIHADGAISVFGTPVQTASGALKHLKYQSGPLRVVPDRDLAAKTLVRLASDLRAAGAERVVIVTERALQ